ncbi:TerD family protein [Klebsiella pneumoniae]|uniref:TerD family protein n=1 Tax=Klebsiella pneumoniae TaxID=573 RepID=UPI0024BE7EB7|nr:TerD family protein [Klebsiella pneumoniae]
MLNAEGKVTGDADFIFYNNLSAAGGSVKLNPGHQHAVVHFALEQIPDTIQKIAITMVIDVQVDGDGRPRATETFC